MSSKTISPSALPPVVVFTGFMGAGKDTAADGLIKGFGYTKVRFADPLKAMLAGLLHSLGKTPEQVLQLIEGEQKNVNQADLQGFSPRYLMQTLGTEWGRDLLHPDFWTLIALQRVQNLVKEGQRVVITDCRFPNEASTLQTAGAVFIRVHRPEPGDVVSTPAHESESHVVRLPYDAVVLNDTTQAILRERVIEALDRIDGQEGNTGAVAPTGA